MDIREDIIAKYREFNEYLMSIDVERLKNEFSRQELNEFKSKLYNTKIRSLAYEISEVTKQMKEEEYPQLLGVHRFPLINEITFLSDKQKIELDKYLVHHNVGDFVYSLWKVVRDEKVRKQLEQWLEEKEVIEKNYAALCPECHDETISKFMNLTDKTTLQTMFTQFKESYTDESYDYLSKNLENGCVECGFTEFEDFKDLRFKEAYRMKIERDKSLDKV